MDTMRAFDEQETLDRGHADEGSEHASISIGTDERRMHVRAYNHWASLLEGRAFPLIGDLQPADLEDFGPHSVLLDFTETPEDPAVAYLGYKLRDECELDDGIAAITQVPSRSLLSRLTDHYLEIIANRAPIGFEAEFVNVRGTNTLYRGILMPYSSDGDAIDFIYGVINWKEVVGAAMEDALVLEMDQAIRAAPRAAAQVPVWADGPNGETIDTDEQDEGEDEVDEIAQLPEDAGLADFLDAAREGAVAFRGADSRSRAALYRALGLCYDFALVADARPEEYAELLEDAGMASQARAPMTPIVKLVFGFDYDKGRLTEFAAALSHGRRLGLGAGELRGFLESAKGGLKSVVKAERALRAPATPRPDRAEAGKARLREESPKGIIQMDTGDEEFVLLIARRVGNGAIGVLTAVDDADMLDRAIRKAAKA
jgi:hypothetical protein